MADPDTAEITRLRTELANVKAQLGAETNGYIEHLQAELVEARVGEERYQCLLHNVGLINDLAKSWNPVTNGKLIDYLNLKVAAIVARTTKSSV